MSPFGGNYTVTCSHDYNHGDVYLTFAANILECCDHCSRYNLNATDNFCLGVSIDISTPGPSGAELSGFECWLKSNLSTLEAYQNSSSNSTGVTTTAIHAAMLNAPLPTPVTVQVRVKLFICWRIGCESGIVWRRYCGYCSGDDWGFSWWHYIRPMVGEASDLSAANVASPPMSTRNWWMSTICNRRIYIYNEIVSIFQLFASNVFMYKLSGSDLTWCDSSQHSYR